MDGLDDRLGGLHKRLDDLDNRLDRHEMRLDAMPTSVGTPIKERIDGIERTVREQLDGAVRSVDETGEGLRNLLGDTSIGLHRRLEDLAARPAVDPTEPLTALAAAPGGARRPPGRHRGRHVRAPRKPRRTASTSKLGNLGGTIDEKLGKLDAALVERPDTTAAAVAGGAGQRGVRASQRRPARRGHGHVRRAHPRPRRRRCTRCRRPRPGPAQRRSRSKVTVKSPNGASAADTVTDDPDD